MLYLGLIKSNTPLGSIKPQRLCMSSLSVVSVILPHIYIALVVAKMSDNEARVYYKNIRIGKNGFAGEWYRHLCVYA